MIYRALSAHTDGYELLTEKLLSISHLSLCLRNHYFPRFPILDLPFHRFLFYLQVLKLLISLLAKTTVGEALFLGY